MVRRARRKGPLNIAVGHAMCPDDAERLATLLREALTQIVRLTMTEIGAALGVHTGPGTLIVSMQPFTKPPR